MQMATTTQSWVTHETVAKCWQHVKILPGAEEVPTKWYIDPDSLTRLGDSLEELAKIALFPIAKPLISKLIDVSGEEIIEASLTTSDILDFVEQNDEQLDSKDEPKPKPESMMSNMLGIVILTCIISDEVIRYLYD